jgi:60 kDa SS-A/Ro ribonucleoprotein
VNDFVKLQTASEHEAITILQNNSSITWEFLPTNLLNSSHIWSTLLPNLPLTAMIRNLGRMTSNGTLAPMSSNVDIVVDKLVDKDYIHKSRVHPISILSALLVYTSGSGVKGSLKWNPITKISDALNSAFYLSFNNVEPTNRKTLLAIDISGSMTYGNFISCPGLYPLQAAAAMAMVTAAVEPHCMTLGFAVDPVNQTPYRTNRYNTMLLPLDISPSRRLDDIVQYMKDLEFGATDCALPMLYAIDNKLDIDTFIVYTDNETWAGSVHPVQALRKYRTTMNKPQAKLIVVGMTSTGFTIADPDDPGMLDVVGFDTATPNIMSDFSR